jgi:hypothetical protein
VSNSPDAIANTARLLRDAYDGTIVLAEGSGDSLLLRRFADPSHCRILVANGKENALGALAMLEAGSHPGIVALVDKDFWQIEQYQHESPNVLSTDTHNAETMLLRSPALDRVLAELGSEAKLRNFEQTCGLDPRTGLVAAGAVLGALRWLNHQRQVRLDFEGLTFSKFIQRESLTVDKASYVRTVSNNSRQFGIPTADHIREMDHVLSAGHDPWHLSCGHDIVEVLSIALTRTLGSRPVIEVRRQTLERELRLAYDETTFRSTALCADIREWELRNAPFRILTESLH